MEKAEMSLLSVRGLTKEFTVNGRGGKSVVHAVNGISFDIMPGETFGLVGESGCGKTTTGRMIAGLTEPTEGTVMFRGRDMKDMTRAEKKLARRDIQMVFQDPFASLDPRITVGKTIEEPLIVNRIGDRAERRKKAEEFLRLVGLQESYYDRYPHEFSGGQRQRIGIARALITHPGLVICDEPVSALDVSVQSQILNLLVSLQKEMGVSYLFIAHAIGVVRYISDWVGVMYLGNLTEVIRADDLFDKAAHPYTEALLSAVPVPEPGKATERILLRGDVPSPTDLPCGCCFHTRCPYAKEICAKEKPPVRVRDGRAMVACHFPLN